MQKKIWMFGVAAALFGAAMAQPTLAQPGAGGGTPPGQQRGMAQMKKMADYLGLTDDQKAQIKPLMKSQAQQVKAVSTNATLSAADKKTKIEAIRKASRQQMMAILTPQQKAKLKQLQKHRNG